MRKRLLRLTAALTAVAAAGTPATAFAFAGCPGNIVLDGSVACHTGTGGDCSSCKYTCDDGTSPTYNMCAT
jgi:hypothetical protein